MSSPNPSVLDILQHLIEDAALKRVLYLGDEAPALHTDTNTVLFTMSPQSLLPGRRFDQESLTTLPASDLVIAGDVLEACDYQAGLQLLAGLRNQLQARICALVPASSPWQFSDFIGLGFKRLAHCTKQQDSVTVYSYAIADYNFTREWNNARFWANPELFGKYWW